MVTQTVLTEMADVLNSAGINYSVSLNAYSGLKESDSDINSIVNRLIGHKTVVRSPREASVIEVVDTLRHYLGYVGDDGAGPGPCVLKSRDFSRLLDRICDSAVRLSHAACGIKSFEFAEGHPHYPVFWDFAFLFQGNEEYLLLVGSSSD